MKKESIISTIFLLLVLAVAIITGLTVISDAFSRYYEGSSPILFTLGVLLIGFVVNTILIEVAHILGAKLGKCNVVSVNIYFICFYKTNNKWKIGIRNFDGLTGETKITTTEKSKLNAYIWMPIVFYAFELAACVLLYTSGQTAESGSALRWLGIAGLLWIILSSMIVVYNFIPAKLDTMTDGYRMMLLTKKENGEALIKYMDACGKASLEGHPVQIEFFENITEFTAELNLNCIESTILDKKYSEASSMLEKMEKAEKLSNDIKREVTSYILFIKLVTGDIESAKTYFDTIDSETRKFISNSNSASAARAYMLVAGLIDKSDFEVSYAVSKKEKVLKQFEKDQKEAEGKYYDEIAAIVEKK